MKKIILSSLVLSLVFMSCKKDDKSCDVNVANIAGTYKMTSLKFKANGSSQEIDIFISFDDCNKDDLYVFNSNLDFEYKDVGTVCSPSESYSAKWSLNGNSLAIDGDALAITSFDCKTIVASETDLSSGTTTATFVKQ